MAKGTARPQPHEVFTPGELPLERPNVYAPRRGSEEKLQRYAVRGQVPVVYGEYGVGKTTLVRRFFQDEEAANRLVYIDSAKGQSLASIQRRVLEQLNYQVTTKQTDTVTTSAGGGVDVVVARLGADVEEQEQSVRELAVSSPTDLGMIEIMANAEVIVVVDEMHQADGQLREDLANLIKASKTGGRRYPKIVLVGTTLDAERIVRLDEGIDRYVKEMQVPLMDDEEARFVVTEGFHRLRLAVEDHVVDEIIRTAAGAPTIVHSICLDMAEQAIGDDRMEVNESDYKVAINRYIEEHGRRLASSYMKAIETTGSRRYRKQILHAMADASGDYATMEEIRVRVSELIGDDVPSTALSGPLRDLKSDAYGSILQDVERYEGGARVHNLNAFKNPMMKSFIRFIREAEEQGLIPESALTDNGQ